MAGQRLKGKTEVMQDIQLAVQVFLVEAVVGKAVFLGIDYAFLYQKFAPGVVAVAGQKGVVQIKNCERQAATSGDHRACRKTASLPRPVPNGSVCRTLGIL